MGGWTQVVMGDRCGQRQVVMGDRYVTVCTLGLIHALISTCGTH